MRNFFQTKVNFNKIVPFFQLAPSTIYLIFFMVAPLFVFIIFSFWRVGSFRIIKEFGFNNYINIFTSKLYLDSYLNSVYIGFIVSIIVAIIGYILAYSIRFYFGKYQNLWTILIYLSIFGGYLVRIYSWKSILGVSGLINGILLSIKVINEPIRFFMYNKIAVIITLVNLIIPYGFITVFSALQSVPKNYIEASRDLGANFFRTFFKITLPLSFNGLVAGFIISFVFSSTDFVVPSLLGGKSGLMISSIIAEQFGITYNWPLGSALSIIFIIIMLIILVLISSIPKFIKGRNKIG